LLKANDWILIVMLTDYNEKWHFLHYAKEHNTEKSSIIPASTAIDLMDVYVLASLLIIIMKLATSQILPPLLKIFF